MCLAQCRVFIQMQSSRRNCLLLSEQWWKTICTSCIVICTVRAMSVRQRRCTRSCAPVCQGEGDLWEWLGVYWCSRWGMFMKSACNGTTAWAPLTWDPSHCASFISSPWPHVGMNMCTVHSFLSIYKDLALPETSLCRSWYLASDASWQTPTKRAWENPAEAWQRDV